MNLDELLGRWSDTGLLEAVGEGRKLTVASCLETQCELNEARASKQWRRLSIPIVVKVFSSTEKMFAGENYRSLERVCRPKFHILNAKYDPKKPIHPGRYSMDELDEESEVMANFSQAVVLELNEMFKDAQEPIKFSGFEPTDFGFVFYS